MGMLARLAQADAMSRNVSTPPQPALGGMLARLAQADAMSRNMDSPPAAFRSFPTPQPPQPNPEDGGLRSSPGLQSESEASRAANATSASPQLGMLARLAKADAASRNMPVPTGGMLARLAQVSWILSYVA